MLAVQLEAHGHNYASCGHPGGRPLLHPDLQPAKDSGDGTEQAHCLILANLVERGKSFIINLSQQVENDLAALNWF